jgi:hypothetical protein
MNGKISIIMSMILVTAAILTVQSSSMVQPSYAQTRVDANTQTAILNMHNQERAIVNPPVSALTWNNDLATAAQAWADNIVRQNLRLDICGDRNLDPQYRQCPPHDPNLQTLGQGENLAWGYNTPVTGPYPSLVQSWINEKSSYTPGTPFTWPSPYGHYTQMVWQTTTQVGCGIAQQQVGANVWDILACRYSPSGNWQGQLPYGQQPQQQQQPARATSPETQAFVDEGAAQQGAGAPPADQGAAAVGEEQNTLGDQGAVQEVPPAQ